jgi:exosortase
MNSTLAHLNNRTRAELALLGALFLALFGPTLVSLVQAWNERPDASHGWFVLPISLYIAWRKRSAFLAAPQRTFRPGLTLVVVGLLGVILSTRAALDSVGRIALVLTLNGILLYAAGPSRYRVWAFPALFLFLMIPIPITVTGAFTFPLQIFATVLSEHSIALIGIPVQRLGNVLQLPAGRLEVAEACSGLRSLMSFVTIGALLAWVTPRLTGKALIVAGSILFALFANVLRITLTAALVEMVGPAAAEGWIHGAVGLVSFMVGLGLFAAASKALGSRWSAQ